MSENPKRIATVEAKELYQRVFSSTDFYCNPFRNRFDDLLILYPTDGHLLTKKQFSALRSTQLECGETSLFLSVVEGDPNFSQDTIGEDVPRHFVFSSSSYEDYANTVIYPLEAALYSHSGNWGILITQDLFAVIGGTPEFIKRFAAHYMKSEQDRLGFLQMCNQISRIDPRRTEWMTSYGKLMKA